MTDFKHILVDVPRPGVSRITLNRPESRNALNNTLRGELYGQLEANDRDADIRVTIIRGAGKAFCAGYDLKANNRADQPFHTAGGDGNGHAMWLMASLESGILQSPSLPKFMAIVLRAARNSRRPAIWFMSLRMPPLAIPLFAL